MGATCSFRMWALMKPWCLAMYVTVCDPAVWCHVTFWNCLLRTLNREVTGTGGGGGSWGQMGRGGGLQATGYNTDYTPTRREQGATTSP